MSKNIFISYQSYSHQIARYIAEALISIGINVWHAEYKILDTPHDKKVEEILAEGVNSSSKAICLTNKKYIDSKWCMDHEFHPLQNLIGPSNMFELKIAKEGLLDSNFFHHSIDYQNSLSKIFRALLKAGLIDQLPPNNWDRHYQNNAVLMRNKSMRILMDISEWHKVDLNYLTGPKIVMEALNYSKGVDNQRMYIRKIGLYDLSIHLLFQTIVSTEESLGEIRSLQDMDIENKEIYERNIRETKSYIKKHKESYNSEIDVIGVHPIYLLGFCHYAFTYYISYHSKKILLRKYIINLPSTQPNMENEIVITVKADYNGYNVNLLEFLQVAPVFDQFVGSLEFE